MFRLVTLLLLFQVPSTQPLNVTDKRLAVGGFDVVSYFEVGRPVKGNRIFSQELEGVTYFFTSTEHATLFRDHPERYLPVFGGYCALGLAGGKLVDADPRVFEIYEGRLVLQRSDWARVMFNTERESNWKKAAQNWQLLTAEPTSP